MNKETEQLGKKVKKELQPLKARVDQSEDDSALNAHEKLTSTMD